MNGYTSAIENETNANTDFRRVLYTSKNSQLVLMSLLPGEDIGLETHQACDQFFRIESGYGKSVIDEHEHEIRGGDAVVVPVGAKHNIINLSSTESLKLYTIYSPPNHKDATVRATKLEAQTPPEKFDGVTTERFSDNHPDSKRIFDERIEKIEVKVFEKIHSVKLSRYEKKLAKEAQKIVKYEHKIDDLKEKMSKIHRAHAV